MATIKRRVWRGEKTGDIGKLQLVEDEITTDLEKGQVIVEVHAVGLNFADVFTCLGLYEAAPKNEPYVPGLECSGVVIHADKHAGGVKVGDRVMCVTRFGGYSTHVKIPWQQTLPLEWTFEEGAAFPCQSVTALYAMMLGGVADKEENALKESPPTILVHSAAGGTGLHACRIAERVGAKVVMTVGSEKKVEFLQKQFPRATSSDIIVRGTPSEFREQLATAAPQGYDCILDSLGGDYFHPAFEALNACGRHIVFGAADWTPQGDSVSIFGWLRLAWSALLNTPTVKPMQMVGANKGVLGFNLIWLFDKLNEFRAAGGVVSKLLALDLPPPSVGQVFPFEEAQNALREFQSGATVGKLVLKVK
eukprot:m.342234 g.342234  ORF g.342234 m.342234 type:complete len:363 (-) comp21128_c0_seq1:172-1260(-)